ncbi:MAG: chitobiase/beta-hexosaminidase C-terminal domain-containing protein [Candidatus Krumholzibacteriota bacterium]
MLDRRVLVVAVLLSALVLAACSGDDTTTPDVVQTVDSPTFTPLAGSFSSIQTVTIDCPTADAEIHFTLDGSDPDDTSALYDPLAGGITISTTTTIKAKAYKDGMKASVIMAGDYAIDLPDVAPPVISPQGGIYSGTRLVSMSCATAGAEIRYTTDGTEPTSRASLYAAPFLVTESTTVQARAYAAEMDPSPIAEETLVIIGGLVAHFPFDGSASDYSGNRHMCDVFGPVLAEDRHGTADFAYQFDGIDDYMELWNEASFDFTEFTISAWIRIDTLPVVPGPGLPGIYTLINKGSNVGNYTLRLMKFGGASYCNLSYAHRTATGTWAPGSSSENINLSTWYHVTVTMDTEISFYINGALDFTSTGMPAAVLDNDQVLIGKRRHASDELPFNGFIDDVRFYDRALTAAEIQLIYDEEN